MTYSFITQAERYVKQRQRAVSGKDDETMSEIEGIYAIWLREAKIYIREKERLISAVISPLLWIFGFGGGLGSSVQSMSGYPYQTFIYPGIMVMTVLFTSLFYGVYIIWIGNLIS